MLSIAVVLIIAAGLKCSGDLMTGNQSMASRDDGEKSWKVKNRSGKFKSGPDPAAIAAQYSIMAQSQEKESLKERSLTVCPFNAKERKIAALSRPSGANKRVRSVKRKQAWICGWVVMARLQFSALI